MFTWLNKQAVRSEEGYEVHFTSRFMAEYREGARVLTIAVEDGLAGNLSGISFDRHAFEKWDHSNVINSPIEQERLLSNFVNALRFQGLEAWY